MKNLKKVQIGFIGSYGDLPISKYVRISREIGKEIARAGAVFIGGVEKDAGLVREAAKAARKAGGIVVSIPRKKEDARDADIVIPSYGAIGLREYLLPLACDTIIAINGGSGTLNEIAVAYQNNIPVVMIENSGGWSQKLQKSFLDKRKKYKFITAKNPKKAVELAIKLTASKREKARDRAKEKKDESR